VQGFVADALFPLLASRAGGLKSCGDQGTSSPCADVRFLVGDGSERQLLGLIEVLDILFSEPSVRGCQYIAAAAELPNPDDAIHRVAMSHKGANRNCIRDLAEEPGATDPEQLSDAYTMHSEGALVLRQVHDRNDAARPVRPLIVQLLRSHLPQPG